jgi:septum formation inhibitor-activating ATPase MinD
MVHLRDLGLLLIKATGLPERNLGLVAAAKAVVRDSHKGAPPIVRKLRLFKEAYERYSSRMSGAVAQIGPERLHSLGPATLQVA